jgi:hypothetical protein
MHALPDRLTLGEHAEINVYRSHLIQRLSAVQDEARAGLLAEWRAISAKMDEILADGSYNNDAHARWSKLNRQRAEIDARMDQLSIMYPKFLDAL